MVEILEQTTGTCVVVRFGGKVTGEQYREFLDAVDERLQRNPLVNIVADLSEFEFYGDFESFKEDFHFGTHEFRSVEKCAFVGDRKWMEVAVKLMGPLTRAEEKAFPSGELDQAVRWATS